MFLENYASKIVEKWVNYLVYHKEVKFEKLIDFKPFLMKALHPSIKKYLNESLFATFQIVDGNLNWNDFEMIFLIWDLYNGQIN